MQMTINTCMHTYFVFFAGTEWLAACIYALLENVVEHPNLMVTDRIHHINTDRMARCPIIFSLNQFNSNGVGYAHTWVG